MVVLADYGAFVEIMPGVEALIHVSEMSWNKRIQHPSKIVNIGNKIDAIILDVDAITKRISLGEDKTFPKNLTRENHFVTPIWFANEPSFVDQLNTASDP